NWCPGAKVETIENDLPGITGGTSFDLDIQFENYNGSGDLGSYKFTGLVFYYGETHNETDAEISDIIAPTNDPRYFRENPSVSIPKISVHTSGQTTINSLDVQYGVKDSVQETYTWNGDIPAYEDKVIELPQL